MQEKAILYPSIKDPGTSVPASFYAASARTVPKNSKTRTAGAVRESDAKIERKLNAWRTAARGELPSSRIKHLYGAFFLDITGFFAFSVVGCPIP
ncbi:MAG: hypothetical protein ACLRXP_07410 [Oscillospiraceae bacterium]